jgi:MraZ protein
LWRFVAEPIFQGPAALTLDAKGRVAFPARHRAQLDAAQITRLVITKNPGHSLLVFPQPAWERFRSQVLGLPFEAAGWKRLFLAHAVEVDLDNSARVLIDPTLRGYAGLEREVMLLGMGSHLEMWDAERLARHEAEVMASPMPDALKGFTF